MRSVNVTILLIVFLLIHIASVICPVTREDLEKCEEEIFLEFNNVVPLDDFLHAYLNIKYETVYWIEETDTNEEIYCGNNVLKRSTRAYYLDMFYVLQDLNLPAILSPLDFCRTKYPVDMDECISDIQAIGCAAIDEGIDCLRYLYIHWKKTYDPGTIAGTEKISDEKLLEAIYGGSHRFRGLSESRLLREISRNPAILQRLSDERLLEDYGFDQPEEFEAISREEYNAFHRRPDNASSSGHDEGEASSSGYNFDEYMEYVREENFPMDATTRQHYDEYMEYERNRSYDSIEYGVSRSEFYEYMEYIRHRQLMEYIRQHQNDPDDPLQEGLDFNEYLEQKRVLRETEYENEYLQFVENERHLHYLEYERNRQYQLHELRFARYGIAYVSYADICEEYIRRKSLPRSFENYYTMHIYDTFKDYGDGSQFKSRSDFCIAYLSPP